MSSPPWGASRSSPKRSAICPGYNVRVVLVIQTPAQLREVYGIHNAETMLKSLAARIVFAPKDFADAREISDELGFTTVRCARRSRRRSGFAFDRTGRRSRSQSVSEQRRALLLPQEVKELGTEEAIVFYEGLRPIRCRKIRYFADRRFRKAILPPPKVSVPKVVALPRASEPAVRPSVAPVAQPPAVGAAPKEEKALIRIATAEDIGYLDTMTEADFADRIPEVTPPDHEGPCTNAELEAMSEGFVVDLKRERGELHVR